MLREDYEKTKAKYLPTALYTNQELNISEINDENILAVHDDTDIRESFDTIMEMMNMMVIMFITFAILLTAVVLYSCSNLSFNERIKELATLKVLVLSTPQIRRLLFTQNFILSLLGTIAGSPLGKILLQYMFDSNGDNMDCPVLTKPTDYIIAGGIVMLIAVITSLFFTKHIKNIDMVGTLKGME